MINQNRKGWLKLYRSFLDFEWYNHPNTKALYIHCLLRANYETQTFEDKIIPAGSFVTSIRNLAKEVGISERHTRTALSRLKSTQHLTLKTTHRFTVIKVENWAKLQGIENKSTQQTTHKATNERHSEIEKSTLIKEYNIYNKELKKEKNINNIYKKEKEEKEKVAKKRSPSFVKPTIDEIKNYCEERNNNIDPENFYDFYESKNWMVGKNKMKDWKAAIRTWERRNKNNSKNGYSKKQKKDDVNIDWLNEYM